MVKIYTDARHGDIRELLQKLKSRICQEQGEEGAQTDNQEFALAHLKEKQEGNVEEADGENRGRQGSLTKRNHMRLQSLRNEAMLEKVAVVVEQQAKEVEELRKRQKSTMEKKIEENMERMEKLTKEFREKMTRNNEQVLRSMMSEFKTETEEMLTRQQEDMRQTESEK